MLKVYTGNHSKTLKDLEVTYPYPENSLSPWEQINWFKDRLAESKDKKISLKTFSPYLLNYLNLALASGEVDGEKLEVKEYYLDEETGEINVFDLKVHDMFTNELTCIDARSLSDPISWIYQEYNKLKENE